MEHAQACLRDRTQADAIAAINKGLLGGKEEPIWSENSKLDDVCV